MADLFGNPFANLSGGGIGDQASRNVNVATLNNTPGGGDADNPFLVNQTGSGQISQNTGGNPFALRPSALAGRTTAFGGQAFDPFGGDGDGGGGGFGDPSDERGTAIDDDIQDFMGHVGLGLGMVSNPAVALGKIGFEAFTGVPLSIQAVTNIANGRSAGDDGHEGDVESMGGDHGAPPGSGTGAGFGSNADEFGGLDPDGEQGGDGGADDGNGGDGQNGEGDDGGPEGLAYGGYVSGPGGPRDDEIDARLSDGEYVIDAETVDAFGPEFFEMIQEQGQGFAGRGRNAFADGGLVGGDLPAWGQRAANPFNPQTENNETVRSASEYVPELGGEVVYPTIRMGDDGNLYQPQDPLGEAIERGDYVVIGGPPGQNTADMATDYSKDISHRIGEMRRNPGF